MATRRTFTREVKVEAVKPLTGQGLSIAEAARRLGVSENLLRSPSLAHKSLLDLP